MMHVFAAAAEAIHRLLATVSEQFGAHHQRASTAGFYGEDVF